MERGGQCPTLRSLFDNLIGESGGVLNKADKDHVKQCSMCQQVVRGWEDVLMKRTPSAERFSPEGLKALFEEWEPVLCRLVKRLAKKRRKSS
jgi:hypothetical protein